MSDDDRIVVINALSRLIQSSLTEHDNEGREPCDDPDKMDMIIKESADRARNLRRIRNEFENLMYTYRGIDNPK